MYPLASALRDFIKGLKTCIVKDSVFASRSFKCLWVNRPPSLQDTVFLQLWLKKTSAVFSPQRAGRFLPWLLLRQKWSQISISSKCLVVFCTSNGREQPLATLLFPPLGKVGNARRWKSSQYPDLKTINSVSTFLSCWPKKLNLPSSFLVDLMPTFIKTNELRNSVVNNKNYLFMHVFLHRNEKTCFLKNGMQNLLTKADLSLETIIHRQLQRLWKTRVWTSKQKASEDHTRKSSISCQMGGWIRRGTWPGG